MTRAERCFEFLRAKGFAHLASEIGWYGGPDEDAEEMAMIRPHRALSPDEAMVMVQLWEIAYEDDPYVMDFRNEENISQLVVRLQAPLSPQFPAAPRTLIEVLARV